MSWFPPHTLLPSSEGPLRSDDKDYPVDENGIRILDESSRGCVADDGAAQHSLILLQSLKQSRHFYSTRLLPTFKSLTNPPNPFPASYTLESLGTVSILIGSCQFNQCTLHQVQYISERFQADLNRTSPQETIQNDYSLTKILEGLPSDELGWLDLDQIGDISVMDVAGLTEGPSETTFAIKDVQLLGETLEQESSDAAGELNAMALRDGAINEESRRCTPENSSAGLEASRCSSDTCYSERQKCHNSKPIFTPQLKKAIQLTATLEIRLAELLHKTYLGQVREPELMELNEVMKAIEREVTSGRFDWASMLAKSRNVQGVQRINKEQTRKDYEEGQDRSASYTAFSHEHVGHSPSPSTILPFANLDETVVSSRSIATTAVELPSAPMLWSRSSPRILSTPETRRYITRQTNKLSSTPTCSEINLSPPAERESASIVSQTYCRSLDGFDLFTLADPDIYGPTDSTLSTYNRCLTSPSIATDHPTTRSVCSIRQPVRYQESLNASEQLYKRGPSVQTLKSPTQRNPPLDNQTLVSSFLPSTSPPANEVIISFPENPDESFLIPLSRSIISRDLDNGEDSIRISFFTPTPSTTLPPPPIHSCLGALEPMLGDQAFRNPDLVHLSNENANDERIELITIVVENYSEEVWKALETSYLGHLKTIFGGTNGREARFSEFQSMLQRGLSSSPLADVPATPTSENLTSAQIDEEHQKAVLERKNQEAKFFRDEAARVYFETHGQWPEDYEPPFSFEEMEELCAHSTDLEDQEAPFSEGGTEFVVTAPATAAVGYRRKRGVKKAMVKRKGNRRQKKRVALSEEETLSDNFAETSEEDTRVVPTRPRTRRKLRIPDYVIESDRELTPLTTISASDPGEDRSQTITVEPNSPRCQPVRENLSKSPILDRRKTRSLIRVPSKPMQVAKCKKRTTKIVGSKQCSRRVPSERPTGSPSKISSNIRMHNKKGQTTGRDACFASGSVSGNGEDDGLNSDDSNLLIM